MEEREREREREREKKVMLSLGEAGCRVRFWKGQIELGSRLF
jgi:hypothetical protein